MVIYQTKLPGGSRGSAKSGHSVADAEQVKRKSPGKSLSPVAGLSELKAGLSLLYTALGAASVRLDAALRRGSQFHSISEHRHPERVAPGWVEVPAGPTTSVILVGEDSKQSKFQSAKRLMWRKWSRQRGGLRHSCDRHKPGMTSHGATTRNNVSGRGNS